MALLQNLQKKMRISYISGHAQIPSRDANNVHLMKMCAAYARLGHTVTLTISSSRIKNDKEPVNVFEHYGVPSSFKIRRIPFPASRLGKIIALRLLMPLSSKLTGSDFVHTRNLAVAWGCARIMKIPVVYELHDSPNKTPAMTHMFRQLIRLTSLRGLVCITQALADHISPYLESTTPILIAPDAVDSSCLSTAISREQSCKKLALKNGEKILAVYTGHLYPGRGIELIIKIAAELQNYFFLIVGGTDQDIERCRQISSHLSNIFFMGHVSPSSVSSYQQAADVLLMPYADKVAVAGGGNTAPYASPLKMFEYMAAGRPIVASTLPVLGEILENGHNALLIPYDRPELWVAGLRQLAANPELGAALAAQARCDVERYTWEQRATNILAFATAARSGDGSAQS